MKLSMGTLCFVLECAGWVLYETECWNVMFCFRMWLVGAL